MLLMAVLPIPACAVTDCRPGDPRCQEWVLVLQPGTNAQLAREWLIQQGCAIGKVHEPLRLVHVWLPRGEVGDRLASRVRAQPWVNTLTDQVTAVPD